MPRRQAPSGRNTAAVASVGLERKLDERLTQRRPPPSSSQLKGRGHSARIEPTLLAADTAGMAKKPEQPKLFWLTYHHPDGAGVVVIESRALLHARLKASLAGADRGLEFVSGHQLDPISAAQIPANTIGRFLDHGDLRKLQRMLLKKKPAAGSVRRRTTPKRRVGKS
jgi:hypothetical protein